MLEVITKWYLSVIGKYEDYILNFNCPHCKHDLSSLDFLDFKSGSKINKKVSCLYCGKTFKLIVEVSE